MFSNTIRDNVNAYLNEEFEDDRNIYFNQYHSSKNLSKERIEEILVEHIGVEVYNINQIEGDGQVARIDGSPILFWQLPQERWLIVYSSSQDRRTRSRLQRIDDYVGWLLEVWIRSETVDNLYRSFSPDDESINVERKWDPYYIYQRENDIPEELEHYYNEHLTEFVEQGIEFNLKTPSWMVDSALNEGLRDDLLDKSEISKTRFTFQAENTGPYASDGGVSEEPPEAGVTVRQGGQVVHRSGDSIATFELLDQIERQNQHFQEFSSVIPQQEYDELENGIIVPTNYEPGKILHLEFIEKEFDEEASLTLSNLLTVGQKDVDIHGIIAKRDELSFTAKSYTTYDNGEYEIKFTESNFGNAALKIRPVSGSVSGLTYIFHKLQEKFDPRIQYAVKERASSKGEVL